MHFNDNESTDRPPEYPGDGLQDPAIPFDQGTYPAFPRELTARVYRFMLSLTGSVEVAQERTKRVLSSATWKTGPPPSLLVDRAEAVMALASAEITADLVERRLPARPAEGTIPTGFELQIHQIADGLAHLAPYQAVLLGLHFFGGLDLPGTARVLGARKTAVERWSVEAFHGWLEQTQPSASPRGLAAEAALAEELFRFAGTIQPAPAWLERLEKCLREEGLQPGAADSVLPQKDWRKVLRVPRGLAASALARRAVSLVAVAALLVVLALTFELTPREGLLSDRDPAVEEGSQAAFISAQFEHQMQGSWVPPADEACESWRVRLEELLGVPADLDYNSPLLPPAIRPQDAGFGCGISAYPSAETVRPAQVQAKITEALNAAGFSRDAGRAPLETAQLAALRFVKPGWLVRMDAVEEDGRVRVWLELAEDRLSPRVDAFLAAWREDNARQDLFMTSDLAGRYPNRSTLDREIGIGRSLGRKPDFTWRILENSGRHARIEVSVRGLLERHTFQMLWVLQNDQWSVSDLAAAGPLFPPAHDSLLVADAAGQVISIDLDSGAQRILIPRSIYKVDATSPGHTSRVALSPDGRWLAVSSPGMGFTWLGAIDGDELIKINHDARLLTWSPDSQELTLVTEDRPREVTHYDLSSNVLSVGCERRAEIRGLAWSPLGDELALEMFSPHAGEQISDGAFQFGSLKIQVVDQECREIRTLVEETGFWEVSPFDLSWSAGAKELWYRDRISISTVNYRARPLGWIEQNPGSPFNEWTRLFRSYRAGALPSELVFSPDGSLAAHATAGEEADSLESSVEVLDDQGRIALSTQTERVERLAWTQEGTSLVLAEQQAGVGTIWRMNPFSGEIEPVGENLIYIGLYSELLAQASRQAPAVERSHAARAPILTADTWRVFESEAAGLRFQYPPRWTAIETSTDEAHSRLVISNIVPPQNEAEAPVLLLGGDLLVEIVSEPWEAGDSLERFLAQELPRYGISPVDAHIRERVIDGHLAYEVRTVGSRYSPLTVFLPTQERLISILASPADTSQLGTFDSLLASIRLTGTEPGSETGASRLDNESERLAQIKAGAEPNLTQSSISPDQRYQAEVIRYECVLDPSGELVSLEELRLVDRADQAGRVVDTYLSECVPMGQGRLNITGWSPTGQTFFYHIPPETKADRCDLFPPTLKWIYPDQVDLGAPGEVQPVEGLWPAFSPDGTRVAFWQGDNLVLMVLDGPLGVIPAALPDHQPGPITWSPDGKYLAYQRLDEGCPAAGPAFLQSTGRPEPVRVGEEMAFIALIWLDEGTLWLAAADGSTWEYLVEEGAIRKDE